MHPTEARSRRRIRYDGRRYGSGKVRGTEARRGPSKSQEAADAALAEILELFNSDELPARVADLLIARQEGTSPMVNWSLPNQLLVLLAGSTDARGYRQWQEVGRHVVKGARAVRILAPIKRKMRETDPATGEESERVFVAGFKAIPVFRFEDTDGLNIDRPDYQPAAFPSLYGVAETWGIRVEYGPHAGRFLGWYSPGDDERIVLTTHGERTFFHELAHAAHARVLADRGETLQGGQRPNQEIVAETVAAVLCRLFDVEPGAYLPAAREYVESYAAGGKDAARAVMRVLGDVQAVLVRIIEAEAAPAVREAGAIAA